MYLGSSYFNKSKLIAEIALLSNMRQVRISTVPYNPRASLFALLARLAFINKPEHTSQEYLVDIKDLWLAN